MVEEVDLLKVLIDNRNRKGFLTAINVIVRATREYEKLIENNELPNDEFSFKIYDIEINGNEILESLNIKTHSYLDRSESIVIDDDPFISTMPIGMNTKHYNTLVSVPVSLFKKTDTEDIKKFTKNM